MFRLLKLLQMCMKEDEDTPKNARLEIRLSVQEKDLIQSYAKLKGVPVSNIIRKALSNEIDQFINNRIN